MLYIFVVLHRCLHKKLAMKSIYSITVIIFLITACAPIDDLILFNKGVAIFEIIDEANFNDELQHIDTTTLEGKITHKTLLNKRDDILKSAIDKFEQVIKNYPNSKLYHKSIYSLAHIHRLLNNENDEIKYLKIILVSNANDFENSGRNGLMDNPYANFKYEASNRLAQIYANRGEFKTALQYKKINEKHPFIHFCGNAFLEEEIYNTKLYAQIFTGLGEKEKALSYLLPHIFHNGLKPNSELVNTTITLLKNNYNSNTLQKDFEKSINNIYSKVIGKGNDKRFGFCFQFLDVEIKIPIWLLGVHLNNLKTKQEIKKELKAIIKESEFYQKLNKK